MHGFVQNQGDAWTVTGAYLDRFVEEQRLLTRRSGGAKAMSRPPTFGAWSKSDGAWPSCSSRSRAGTTCRDFAPEPITADDVQDLDRAACLQRAERTLDELARRRSDLTENDRQLVDALLSHRASLPARLRELLPDDIDAVKIRHHGDFHLGQMLIVKDDVFIIDFEGEPRRSIEDRRRKAPGGARRRRAHPLDRLFRQPPRSSARSSPPLMNRASSHARSMAGAKRSVCRVSRRLPAIIERREALAAVA